MGYAYLSKGKKQGYKILIDEAMDISAVPGEKFFPGTEAVTADGATRYHLNNAHEWVEVTGDTPGGGWPEDLPLPSEGGYGYTDEDETVHKIDNKYLPEGSGLPEVAGSGKALVSVNGEWVEQDGYGYKTVESATIVDHEEVQIQSMYGQHVGAFPIEAMLNVGSMYTVTIDDDSYELELKERIWGGQKVAYFGELPEGTGWGFIISVAPPQATISFEETDAESVVVSISGDVSTPHKFDESLIPDPKNVKILSIPDRAYGRFVQEVYANYLENGTVTALVDPQDKNVWYMMKSTSSYCLFVNIWENVNDQLLNVNGIKISDTQGVEEYTFRVPKTGLPRTPSQNGTYTLSLTVDGDTESVNWTPVGS